MSEVEQRLSGAISDRYQIIRKVGAGGMASVFLAQDRKLDRKVAIKVMDPDLAVSVTGPRFLQEITIAANLAHPHIVPVHDSGTSDGLLYFVMRFEEGETVQDLVDREGALPVSRAVSIARDVADGLAYAHEMGVVHRDIKPANILLSKVQATGGHALIADFGVARAVEAATTVDCAATAAALGTPHYMSPEQASGSQDVDGRSDIYSLGCMMYEMLTGKPPYSGGSPAAVMASHFHFPVPPVRDARPEVPSSLAKTVHRAMAKAPEDRFENAAELCQALDAARAGASGSGFGFEAGWQTLPSGSRKTLLISGLVFLIAVSVALFELVARWGGPTLDPSTMVVLPFRDAQTTAEEEALLTRLADELTRQINRWEPVTAVPQLALSGIRFDLGVGDSTIERTQDGLDVAEAMGAGILAALSARIQGDSVRVSAQLFDPGTGRNTGIPFEAWGDIRDPSGVAGEVAHLILGLEGSPAEIAGLYLQSSVPEALIQYEAGRRALGTWRLAEAETAFRRASDLDPTFAMAHHMLSLTHLWQWEEGTTAPGFRVEDISLESTAALRNSLGISLGDSLHILAFNRFQAGDYDAARSHYRTLLERDSADVYAWSLLGSVEFHDPWLVEAPGGALRPRANWELARRSFNETVRLAPGLHGAYEHVFNIERKVSLAAQQESAPGFEAQRGEFIPPWARTEPSPRTRVFWPAFLDSLVWLDPEDWKDLPNEVALGGANVLMEESQVTLRRWAAFEPDQARPQRELAGWALLLRSRLRGPQPPKRVDSLTVEAFEYSSRALALSPDTARSELFQLANLRLALGDIEGARSTWDFARDWAGPDPDEVLPPSASNVLLYSGRPSQALEMLALEPSRVRYYPDPVTGDLISDAGADPLIQKARILAATGADGPTLEQALVELLNRLDDTEDRTDRERNFLRAVIAPRVAGALAGAPAALEPWLEGLDLPDPLWALLQAEGADRAGLLQAALEAGEWNVRDPARSYLLGTVAQEIGEDELAVRLFSRLDSLAYTIDARDLGWGFLVLSYHRRGRAYQAMVDTERAGEFRARFSEAWLGSDLPALPRIEDRP